MGNQKFVSYESRNEYYTVGDKAASEIWFVLHGYQQQAEFFCKKFSGISKGKLLIFPAAPSKFYTDYSFSRVGSSWLTKVNIDTEVENNINYLDKVWNTEYDKALHKKIVLFGFSQGVSMISRWAERNKIPYHKMIMWAGSTHKKLNENSFSYLDKDSRTILITGKTDPLINGEKLEKEKSKIEKCFPFSEFLQFDGGHSIDGETLKKCAEK